MSDQPTQTRYPWRATARTFVAYMLVALPAYIIIVPIVTEELGAYLPPKMAEILLASAAFVGALVAVITRIMAIPSVNDALAGIGLSATPEERE